MAGHSTIPELSAPFSDKRHSRYVIMEGEFPQAKPVSTIKNKSRYKFIC
jgi:hypothetical protein